MSAENRDQTTESPDQFLRLAEEMGVLTETQCHLAIARQQNLRRVGIKLSIGQTLLERRLLTPAQLKTLMEEMGRRGLNSGVQPAPRQPQSGPDSPTRRFGPYELLSIVSEKDHYRLLKARDPSMDRLVALKLLPRALASDPQWVERFKREMQLVGRLSHPNIVTAYGAGEIDGHQTIIMEFVEGQTLGARLEREGNVPEKEAWLITREVAKGLAYAAVHGILHRNIKPDNVLCSPGGRVKIIDMGFSKSLLDSTSLTADGTTVGTPFYISPEQAKGTRDLDPRTDIYSLGCTAFHMLTGSPPFWGEQITEIMLKHVEAPRPDPREILPEISEHSAALVKRMMAINPEDRPPSAEELVHEIDELIPKLPKLFAAVRPSQEVTPSDAGLPAVQDAAKPSAPAASVKAAPRGFIERLGDWMRRLRGH